MASPSPAACVAWYLNSKGVAKQTPTGTDWPLRIGRLGDDVDKVVALYDTGGFSPNTKWLLDIVTVQALIRSPKDDYLSGWNKAQDVKDTLLGVEPQLVGTAPNTVWWSGITMLADIAFLHYDASARAVFSINFRILQEQPKSTLSNREPLDYYGP